MFTQVGEGRNSSSHKYTEYHPGRLGLPAGSLWLSWSLAIYSREFMDQTVAEATQEPNVVVAARPCADRHKEGPPRSEYNPGQARDSLSLSAQGHVPVGIRHR